MSYRFTIDPAARLRLSRNGFTSPPGDPLARALAPGAAPAGVDGTEATVVVLVRDAATVPAHALRTAHKILSSDHALTSVRLVAVRPADLAVLLAATFERHRLYAVSWQQSPHAVLYAVATELVADAGRPIDLDAEPDLAALRTTLRPPAAPTLAGRRYNPPPNWPAPPSGWQPTADWRPDPSWPPLPPNWQLWLDDGLAATDRTRPIRVAVAATWLLMLVLALAGGASSFFVILALLPLVAALAVSTRLIPVSWRPSIPGRGSGAAVTGRSEGSSARA